MSLLDLPGPDFLLFYVVGGLGALGVYGLARMLWRQSWRQSGSRAGRAGELHPYEVAYLGGGMGAAIDAAVTSLAHRRLLEINAEGRLCAVDGPAAYDPSPEGVFRGRPAAPSIDTLEALILERARSSRGVLRYHLGRLRAGEAEIAARLAERGLLVRGRIPGLVARLPLALLFALGGVKIAIGVTRDRPVFFLLALVVATFVALCKLPAIRLTSRGEEVLEELRRERAALASTAQTAPEMLSGDEAALAYALFGAAALGGTLAGLSGILLSPRPQGWWEHHAGGGVGCGGATGCGGGGGCGGCGGCGG